MVYSRRINKKLFLDHSIDFSNVESKNISNFNIGNIHNSISYRFFNALNDKLRANYIFGLHLPLTNSNDKISKQSLPMVYQTSLGTVDVTQGILIYFRRFLFNNLIQIPILNFNTNSFIKSTSILSMSETSNNLKRPLKYQTYFGYSANLYKERIKMIPRLSYLMLMGYEKYNNFGSDVFMKSYDSKFSGNINFDLAFDFKIKKDFQLSIQSGISIPYNFYVNDVYINSNLSRDGLYRLFYGKMQIGFQFN